MKVGRLSVHKWENESSKKIKEKRKKKKKRRRRGGQTFGFDKAKGVVSNLIYIKKKKIMGGLAYVTIWELIIVSIKNIIIM